MFVTLIILSLLFVFSIVCGAITLLLWCRWKKRPIPSKTLLLHAILQVGVTTAIGIPATLLKLGQGIYIAMHAQGSQAPFICTYADYGICTSIVRYLNVYDFLFSFSFYILFVSSTFLVLRLLVNVMHHAVCCSSCGQSCCGCKCDAACSSGQDSPCSHCEKKEKKE